LGKINAIAKRSFLSFGPSIGKVSFESFKSSYMRWSMSNNFSACWMISLEVVWNYSFTTFKGFTGFFSGEIDLFMKLFLIADGLGFAGLIPS
jgi:hypothetical protein